MPDYDALKTSVVSPSNVPSKSFDLPGAMCPWRYVSTSSKHLIFLSWALEQQQPPALQHSASGATQAHQVILNVEDTEHAPHENKSAQQIIHPNASKPIAIFRNQRNVTSRLLILLVLLVANLFMTITGFVQWRHVWQHVFVPWQMCPSPPSTWKPTLTPH